MRKGCYVKACPHTIVCTLPGVGYSTVPQADQPNEAITNLSEFTIPEPLPWSEISSITRSCSLQNHSGCTRRVAHALHSPGKACLARTSGDYWLSTIFCRLSSCIVLERALEPPETARALQMCQNDGTFSIAADSAFPRFQQRNNVTTVNEPLFLRRHVRHVQALSSLSLHSTWTKISGLWLSCMSMSRQSTYSGADSISESAQQLYTVPRNAIC